MTLTTETLNLWRNNAEITAGETAEDDPEHIAAKAILALTAELLANREAQPVSSECDHGVYANGTSACLVDIPKETAEVICRGISQATGCKVDWHYIGGRVHIKALAPPAPAVPDNLAAAVNRLLDCDGTRGHFSAIRCSDAREEVERLLAQPVSSGYKLVPVEPTENMIIDGFESDAFMALADAVNEKNGWPYGCKESAECVEGIFKAMLSAAPEKN
ncbi:hypothetical protein [Serratia marcescens]|uniref:hypothetical protein n=1 Tax=Serratia marcescens TaxID=615 RepID=UPI0007C93668|nr:hypothetical protein [Serratia marcescens]OAH27084.1 hypothetical protein AYJ10_09200 [Serratia marcescens]